MSYKFKYGNQEIEIPKKSESLCYQYDLGGNVNLNNITAEGYYHQLSNAKTNTSLNYPTAEAGLLTVIKRGYIYQTYQTYCNSGFWYRSQYNGIWYDWKKGVSSDKDTIAHMTSKGGYLGIDNATGGYLRTPQYGLLPNTTTSGSNIGTSSWKFSQAWFSSTVNSYYFVANNNQGLRVLDTGGNPREILYMNPNNQTVLPNNDVVVNQSITANTYYASNWYRSTGTTGWYSQTYGGGIHMTDSTYVRVYNNKQFYCSDRISSGSSISSPWWDTQNTNEFNINSGTANIYFGYRTGWNKVTGWKFCNGTQSTTAGGAVYAASYNNMSDRKAKENIQELHKAKEFILSLQPCTYILKNGESHGKRKHMGFIAQDVSKTLQNLDINDMSIVSASVIVDKEDLSGENEDVSIKEKYFEDGTDDDKLNWYLNYIEFIAPMVATIQEQQKEIDELKLKVNKMIELMK